MAHQYTVIYKRRGDKKAKEAGPFNMEGAFTFIYMNQPIEIQVIREEKQ